MTQRWCPDCVTFVQHRKTFTMKGRCQCSAFPISDAVVKDIQKQIAVWLRANPKHPEDAADAIERGDWKP